MKSAMPRTVATVPDGSRPLHGAAAAAVLAQSEHSVPVTPSLSTQRQATEVTPQSALRAAPSTSGPIQWRTSGSPARIQHASPGMHDTVQR
jgi:hypothetical protein